jgi:hypothetical protein
LLFVITISVAFSYFALLIILERAWKMAMSPSPIVFPPPIPYLGANANNLTPHRNASL